MSTKTSKDVLRIMVEDSPTNISGRVATSVPVVVGVYGCRRRTRPSLRRRTLEPGEG